MPGIGAAVLGVLGQVEIITELFTACPAADQPLTTRTERRAGSQLSLWRQQSTLLPAGCLGSGKFSGSLSVPNKFDHFAAASKKVPQTS